MRPSSSTIETSIRLLALNKLYYRIIVFLLLVLKVKESFTQIKIKAIFFYTN